MKWLRDTTGRFRQRPHYTEEDLERTCEDAITDFLQEQQGRVFYPISTSDLTVLIERSVDDLDLGCELDDGVEGLTDFIPRKKPRVKISSQLLLPALENRLRTTLTHEYGHVLLHGFLFCLEDDLQRLFEDQPHQVRNQCRREAIHRSSDWMEWQAGYACGALLAPRTPLVALVKAFRAEHGIEYAEIGTTSPAGRALIDRVAVEFQVSREAARVRLEQRQILKEHTSPSLF